MRAIALHLTNSCTFGRRLLEIILISLLNEFSNIPPKLRSLNAANTHFFHTKIHFFLKKFAYLHFL